WKFSDGSFSTANNPVKTFAAAGNYSVTLIGYFGNCTDSLVKTIIVANRANVAFSSADTIGCKTPHTATFSNMSAGAVSYLWNFGDGITSTLANPTHTYTTTGNFTVTLIAVNANGCADTLVKPNYIKLQAPEVSINNLTQRGCAPFTWTFTATVNSVDPVVSYLWNFGDGSGSTAQGPTHIFSTGSYDISLIITTAGGCKDTVTVQSGIIASTKPAPAFTATPREVCAFNDVRFTDQSTGTVDEWIWQFGDGGGSTAQHPVHQYQDTGHFTVTFIAGNNGCYDTLRIPNYIHVLPPIANFELVADCAQPYLKKFIDRSIGADEYYWDFGDGNNSTLSNPTHTYAAPGTYTVLLTVKNNITGCTHSRSMQVIVADEDAAFTASSTEICAGSSTSFSAAMRHANGIISYQWNFGDGTTGTGRNVSHSYANSGNYSVILVITDAAGCKDTLAMPNYIRVNGPVANFNAAVPGSCLQTAVNFSDLSTTDGLHAITQWAWNYGDGSVVNVSAPPFTHMYSAAGTYPVSLTVTDAAGCTSTKTKANHLIISTPVAAFKTVDTLSCPGSGNTSLEQASYRWDFGDGTFSNAASPSHFYNESGVYISKLTITSAGGCISVKTKKITVKGPKGSFSYDNRTGCAPLTVTFKASTQNRSSFVWDFNDGTTISSNDSIVSHSYSVPGIYLPKMILKDAAGCTVPIVGKDTIFVKGVNAAFSSSTNLLCDNGNVLFNNQSVSNDVITNYQWKFGNGQSSSAVAPVQHFASAGNYFVTLTVTTAAGCVDSVKAIQPIRVVHSPVISITQSPNGCVPLRAQIKGNLLNPDSSVVDWKWSVSDGRVLTNKIVDSLMFING
ncbi:MAG: PKD domain-containing protein, partial [Chitinophagaceae bacterium]